MQATVATLLLITSTVILTCVVIDYAVTIVEATLKTENMPQLQRLKSLQTTLLNQTDALLNQTKPLMPNTPTPTP